MGKSILWDDFFCGFACIGKKSWFFSYVCQKKLGFFLCMSKKVGDFLVYVKKSWFFSCICQKKVVILQAELLLWRETDLYSGVLRAEVAETAIIWGHVNGEY